MAYIEINKTKRPQCNECKKPNLEMHEFFYRCSDSINCRCNYDLCRNCALINCDPPVLNAVHTFHFHEHEMTRHPFNFPRWCCDASKEDKFPLGSGQCESYMKNTNHSTHIQGY